MASNGHLTAAELYPIPGGELANHAAYAWLAPHGPAANGLLPSGSRASYRTYDEQVYFWNLYLSGQGNLAAVPGTSNHGWGAAVDLLEPWMREWIDEHGHEFGWAKTEAFSEWWHVNWTGKKFAPPVKPLEFGNRGPRVKKLTSRLAYVRRPGGRSYLERGTYRYTLKVKQAVQQFQRDQNLHVDGVAGPQTIRRLTAVFHRQWQKRHRGLTQHHGSARVSLWRGTAGKRTRGEFARAVLREIGAPDTWRNRAAMMSWAQAEGDGGRFNMLNCIQRMPGSTNFNDLGGGLGVQNYRTFADGVHATVHTLLYGAKHDQHGYRLIVGRLRRNVAARKTLEAVEVSAWGTGGLGLKTLLYVRLALPLYEHHSLAQ